MTGPVLVAGGAGYIGSHVAHRLLVAGRDVVVLDDLSTRTHRQTADPRHYVGDLFDTALVGSIIAEHGVDTIIHAAASHHPIQRMSSTAAALACFVKAGVSKFVFTSSCAVYGSSRLGDSVDETCAPKPQSTYGLEKLALEQLLLSLSRTAGLRCVLMRCFNVAGAYRGGRFSGSAGDPTRLINMACQVAVGRRTYVPVYGSSFATRDGTCVRDYVHVDDVARAYVNAVSYLDAGGRSEVLNCGSGHGHSVREVLRVVGDESGVLVQARFFPSRLEDMPFMVSSNRRIRETLGWFPSEDTFLTIVSSALECERAD
ncbi:NAD-dependent epimerase/dehydratase family protein [Stenotrophomonas sp. NPDC077464]|uniref:NAD-dependent epimerase/dehydratase family protein n=1 Tax=unclassified Stenotrophomonas TaxID=196198 RepID=UPI0037D54695